MTQFNPDTDNPIDHLNSVAVPPTFLTARGLAAYAGCSPQVIKSRLESGELIPVARLSNGGDLFTFSQASILAPKD